VHRDDVLAGIGLALLGLFLLAWPL